MHVQIFEHACYKCELHVTDVTDVNMHVTNVSMHVTDVNMLQM